MGQTIKTISQQFGYVRPGEDLLISAYGYNELKHSEDEYGNVTNSKRKFFIEVFTQNYQCMGIDRKGNIYTWGLNNFGQLGNGKVDNYFRTKSSDLKKDLFIDNFSLINPIKSILYKKRIVKFSGGNNFSAAIDNVGILYTWGLGNDGQLGYDLKFNESHVVNFKDKCQLSPKAVDSFIERNILITDVACGKDFSLALDEKGNVYSFGNNEYSQLGREFTVIHESNPKKIEPLEEKIAKICAGWRHGMALSADGNVFIWGNPFVDYDEAFETIKRPIKIENIGIVNEIASGFHHFVVLKHDNQESEVLTWGGNDYGQLGYISEKEFTTNPRLVAISPLFGKPLHIYCGAFTTFSLLNDGKIIGFGHNYNKEIGDYNENVIDRPVEFGHVLDKDSQNLAVNKILGGNGFTLICQSNEKVNVENEKIRDAMTEMRPLKEDKTSDIEKVEIEA